MVDLGLFRQARDVALQDRAKNAEGLEDFHPLHGATAAEYRRAMTLVEMAWNFPIVTQHSTDSAALVEDFEHRLARLPAEIRTLIEGMLRARATTYARDPRTARVTVENDGRGGLTVNAESRLVPGATPE